MARRPVRSGAKSATASVKPRAPRVSARQPAVEPIPTFADIIGHDRSIGILKSGLSSKRVHHAWLFAGPSGVGKRTTARAFASMLLDPTMRVGKDGEPSCDPDSPAQILLHAGTHPDFHEVSKEMAAFSRESSVRDSKQRTLAVEVLREFVIEPAERTAALPAGVGALASKVFIIDEAEYAADAGQNAMLKTLEEPPAGTVIILVTSAPHRLLATIRSRCQTLVFGPVPPSLMDRWLAERMPDLSDAQLAWLKGLADGAPGEALRLVGTGVLEWQSALERSLDEAMSGRYVTSLAGTMATLIDGWATARTKENPDASKEAARHAASHLMIRAVAARAREHLGRAAGSRNDVAERHAECLERLHEAQRQIDANVQPIFVLDNWLAGLAQGR